MVFWSAFSLIRTKPTNRLSYIKLKKLVFCYYNTKIRTKKIEREYARKEPKVDPLDEFTLPGDNCLDERENPLC